MMKRGVAIDRLKIKGPCLPLTLRDRVFCGAKPRHDSPC